MWKLKCIIKNILNVKDNKYFIRNGWIDLSESQIEYLRNKKKFFLFKNAMVVFFSLLAGESIGTDRYGVFIDCLCKAGFAIMLMFFLEYLKHQM